MIATDILLAFIATSCIACLLPGPAVLFAVSTTVSQGLRPGLKAILGLQLGFLLQVIAASCGLSAILLTSGQWFSILKTAGALYLLYLGISIVITRASEQTEPGSEYLPANHHPFLKGVLINVLNPKITVFFIAYIPQFVIHGSTSAISQIILLGIIFSVIGTGTTIMYALFGRIMSTYFHRLNIWGIFSRWLPASIFIGFGAKLATTDN